MQDGYQNSTRYGMLSAPYKQARDISWQQGGSISLQMLAGEDNVV